MDQNDEQAVPLNDWDEMGFELEVEFDSEFASEKSDGRVEETLLKDS